MILAFAAKEVNYSEALDGDIKQVSFSEEPEPELDYSKKNCPLPPPIKSVIFSACYEFPPYKTTVEWCDGEDYDGGEYIKEIDLTETKLTVLLENDFTIIVNFKTDEVTFKNISDFLIGRNK